MSLDIMGMVTEMVLSRLRYF